MTPIERMKHQRARRETMEARAKNEAVIERLQKQIDESRRVIDETETNHAVLFQMYQARNMILFAGGDTAEVDAAIARLEREMGCRPSSRPVLKSVS